MRYGLRIQVTAERLPDVRLF